METILIRPDAASESLSRLDDNGMESGVAKFVSRSQTGEAGTDDHQRRAGRRSGNGQWR
jgi:hypothetical protein